MGKGHFKEPDQVTLISGGKGQFCIPTVNVCTTTLMNCKTQEAPEAVFLSRFFFLILSVPISSHCMSGNTDCLLYLMFVCVWLQTSGKRKWNKGTNSSSFTNTYFNIYIYFQYQYVHLIRLPSSSTTWATQATAYLHENGLGTDVLGYWNLLSDGSFSLWSARAKHQALQKMPFEPIQRGLSFLFWSGWCLQKIIPCNLLQLHAHLEGRTHSCGFSLLS